MLKTLFSVLFTDGYTKSNSSAADPQNDKAARVIRFIFALIRSALLVFLAVWLFIRSADFSGDAVLAEFRLQMIIAAAVCAAFAAVSVIAGTGRLDKPANDILNFKYTKKKDDQNKY